MSALPRTQVLNSPTFKAPPLEDKSLCLPDFYDWQALNSPNHPFFLYEDGLEKIRTILWAEAIRGIHRAAHLVASRVSPEDAAAALEGRPIIVAALAATGLYPSPPNVVSMPISLTPCRHRDLHHDRSRNFASRVFRIPDLAEELTRSCCPSAEKDWVKLPFGRRRAHAPEACQHCFGVIASGRSS